MRTKLGWLTAFYGALVGFQAGPTADDPILQVRVVHEAPNPDREAGQYEGETIHLGPILLTDADLIEVRPSTRGGQLRLVVDMTEEAAERVFEATSDQVGERLAILLEGRIRSVAGVREPIGKGPDTVLGTDPARGWPAEMDLGPVGEDTSGLIQRIRERWPARGPG